MKILVICNKSPWPTTEGGPIAMSAMICGLLNAGHEVKVIAASTNKYPAKLTDVPTEFRERTRIEFIPVDLSLSIGGALLNLLLCRSYHVSRFYTRPFRNRIAQILKEETFDIVQLEMLYSAIYLPVIRRYSHAPVVLRAHNIEHQIWYRDMKECQNPLLRLYKLHLYLTLKHFELKALRKANGIVTITDFDARELGRILQRTNIISVPFGVDLDKLPKASGEVSEPTFFHIGTMNWFPNDEGIRWLIDKVWPTVMKRLPDAKLFLAGRLMRPWLLVLNKRNVKVDGAVEDAWEYMGKHAVMVVPLFQGSGIRIKIIEAMAMGKAVIATPKGAQGINCENGVHLLIARNAEEFASAICRLYTDKNLRKTLGENARQLIIEEHDNNVLMRRITNFYNELAAEVKNK